MNTKTERELNTFLDEWKVTADTNKTGTRESFLHFKSYLAKKDGVVLDFVARPGVTYSLRAVHTNQTTKNLFVLVDVIEDANRWLSVCFYSDMITDVDEKGDLVPGGLMGEDAVCFDLEEYDENLIRYIEARLDEACASAVAAP